MKKSLILNIFLIISVSYGCLKADNEREARDFSDGNFLKTQNIIKEGLIPSFKGLAPREELVFMWTSEILYGEQLVASLSLPSASELGAKDTDGAQINFTNVHYDYAADSCSGNITDTEVFFEVDNITSSRKADVSLLLNTRKTVKFIIKNKAECKSIRLKLTYHSKVIDQLEKIRLSDYFDTIDTSIRKLTVFINPNSSQFSFYKSLLEKLSETDSTLEFQIVNSSTKEASDLMSTLRITKVPAFHYNRFGTETILEENRTENELRSLLGL